jgi:Na+-translocating ferredoxin:NAD+ oxidoreductase RnfD subunit
VRIAGINSLQPRITPSMTDPATTKSERTRRMMNWTVLAVLVALAAALYFSVIIKIAKYGY